MTTNFKKALSEHPYTLTGTLTTCKHSQTWSGHNTQGNDLRLIQPGWERGGYHISFFLLPPALIIVLLIRKRSQEEAETTT